MRNKGFTLVEVLIALLIIAIALTAVIHATTQTTRSLNRVQEKMIAHWVGMNVLSEVQTQLIVIPKDASLPPGKTEMLGAQWYWTIRTEPMQATPSELRVQVSVENQQHHFITTVIGYAKK